MEAPNTGGCLIFVQSSVEFIRLKFSRMGFSF